MESLAERLADAWIGRYRRPDPAALAAVATLAPATVVTGGSEGIGLALAERFAAAGHAVLIVARRPERLAVAAAKIRSLGRGAVHTLALDVTAADAADRLELELASLGLYGDVLVNNAGMGLGGAFTEHAEADIAALLDCNVRALTLLTRRFLPDMLRRGRGGILNVASVGGLVPGPYQAAYYASKAYVVALTTAAQFEARGRGVRIAVLAPGPVETAFHARMGAQSAIYRLLLPALAPKGIARAGYRGFCWGRCVILPGMTARILAISLWIVPRSITVPIVGWLLRPRGEAGDA